MINPDPQEHRSGRQGLYDSAYGHDGLKAAHFVHETGQNLHGRFQGRDWLMQNWPERWEGRRSTLAWLGRGKRI